MKAFWTKTESVTPKQGAGKAIALMNQKGGVGKTTMAFNLAHALKKQGHKVLCIDMDPQHNFSSLFGVKMDDRPSVHQLLINSVRELKALHTGALLSEVLIPVSENLDLLPAGQELSGFELTVAAINSPRQLILQKFLERNELRSQYDFIVIDGPPTLGLLVVNILCAVDGVLYPFVPDSFSRQGLKNIQQVVEDIRDMEICETPRNLGYIPNLFDGRRKQVRSDLDLIAAELTEARLFTPFTNRVQFTKAHAAQKSVFDFEAGEFKEIQNQFLDMALTVQQGLHP